MEGQPVTMGLRIVGSGFFTLVPRTKEVKGLDRKIVSQFIYLRYTEYLQPSFNDHQ